MTVYPWWNAKGPVLQPLALPTSRGHGPLKGTKALFRLQIASNWHFFSINVFGGLHDPVLTPTRGEVGDVVRIYPW